MSELAEIIHILLVEDNSGDAVLFEDMLMLAPHFPHSLHVVDRCDKAQVALQNQPYDVVMLDLSLPDSQGLETVYRLRHFNSEIPLVVLTGLDDEEMGLAALKAGAQDYLVKQDANTGLLVRAIRFAIERSRAKQATRDWELARLELAKERELSDLKSQFITLVSHEFRTPLTIINTSSELLQRYADKLTAEKRERHLNNIRDAIEHITGLLDDVVLAGSAQTDMIHVEYQTFDLQQFIGELITTYINTHHPPQEILFLPVGNHEMVTSDKQLMRHIVLNLLQNAVSYSPADSNIMVQLSYHENYTVLRIADQGIGIPESDQARIFNVFYRGGNISNIGGTGLGLYIVKTGIDLLGGSISFETEASKGTTFSVVLPNKPKKALIQSDRDEIKDISSASDGVG